MVDHESLFVADLHCDTVHRLLQGMDFSIRNEIGHIDLPRLIEAGVDTQVFACFVENDVLPEDRAPMVHRMLDAIERMVAENSELMGLANSSIDIEKNLEEGKISIIRAVENGLAINNSIDNLREFYRRGVRILTLAHNRSNDWCISSGDNNPAFDGLTDFGREVVGTMEELGMIVDLSHVGVSGVAAVLEIAKRPVIASHSCARSLCDYHRNLTDDQIKGIAATGGMIGINFLCEFLSPVAGGVSKEYLEANPDFATRWGKLFSVECSAEEYAGMRKALMPFVAEWEKKLRGVGVDTKTVVDHIDHMVALVGPDHVGLGSDYDGITFAPAGMEDCTGLPRLTPELDRREYSPESIGKIMGGNFFRVFREVCG